MDECATQPDICPETATCTNTVGGFECVCAEGFVLSSGACVDVNECANGTAECGANASCANNVGSFDCVCNEGFSGDGQVCTADEDPCAAGGEGCGEIPEPSDGCSCNTAGQQSPYPPSGPTLLLLLLLFWRISAHITPRTSSSSPRG